MKKYTFKNIKHSDLLKFLPEIGFENSPAVPHLFYNTERTYRYRFTTHGLRYEMRLRDGTWERVSSAYLKDLTFVNGKLKGLKIGGMNG